MLKIIRPESVDVSGAVEIPDAVYEAPPVMVEVQSGGDGAVKKLAIVDDSPESMYIAQLLDSLDIDDEQKLRAANHLIKGYRAITQRAEDEAQIIIDNAQKSADDKYRQMLSSLDSMKEEARATSQKLLREADATAAKIRDEARALGLADGIREKGERIDACLSALIMELEEIKAKIDSIDEEYCKELIKTSADIASKLIYKKIEQDDLILYDLCQNALKGAKGSHEIKLTISENLTNLTKKLTDELGSTIDVEAVGGVDDGTVIVKCDSRILNASILEQLLNLKSFFEI